MSKNSFGDRVKRAVIRSPIAPVDMLVNQSTKQIFTGVSDQLFSKRKYICPICTQGSYHLASDDDQDDSQMAVWACEACGHEIVTKTKDPRLLKQHLLAQGTQMHALGEKEGINVLSEDEVKKGVAKYLFKSRVSLVILLFMLFLLPIAYMNGSFFSVLNVVLAGVFFLIQMLHASFCAFKAHNRLFFVENHKELAWMWLKKGNYLTVWDYTKG